MPDPVIPKFPTSRSDLHFWSVFDQGLFDHSFSSQNPLQLHAHTKDTRNDLSDACVVSIRPSGRLFRNQLPKMESLQYPLPLDYLRKLSRELNQHIPAADAVTYENAK